MKKNAILLCLLLCVSIAFTACGTKTPESSAAPTPGGESTPTETNIQMGQALFAAHGVNAYAIATVAVSDGVIVGAWLDEFQFMNTEAIPVPNGDNVEGIGQYFPEGRVLGSKRVNAATYSENMKAAGATNMINENFMAIEDYVVGKTVDDISAIVVGDDQAVVDAVAGSTLVDTKGYLNAFIEAANNLR